MKQFAFSLDKAHGRKQGEHHVYRTFGEPERCANRLCIGWRFRKPRKEIKFGDDSPEKLGGPDSIPVTEECARITVRRARQLIYFHVHPFRSNLGEGPGHSVPQSRASCI